MRDTDKDLQHIKTIRDALRDFAAEREWDQFHTPKNLSMALTAEVGELVEHFQWLTQDEIGKIEQDPVKKEAIADELADVLSYLVRLSDKLGVDLADAFWAKIEKNAAKYPVGKAKGSAKKYTEI